VLEQRRVAEKDPLSRIQHESSTRVSVFRLALSGADLLPQIGSIEGLSVPDHETYAYTASKAALHQLSRHLGGKLGREGIVSNTIACGQFLLKIRLL
jgi:NAD(P)-dependent dehydrogenase (short-subunit alcohol dehydrogenase family)